MRKCVTDIWAGVGFLALALAFGVQLSELSGVSRVFPQALSVFVGIGGVYFILKGGIVLLRQRATAHETQETVAWRRIGIISALAVAYAFIVKGLGFFASTFLFLFLAFMLLGDRKATAAKSVLFGVLFAGIFCLCIWVGFVQLLNVPTPTGILP